VKGVVDAARYLTIVPVGGARAAAPPGAAVAWFPAVGLMIGAILVAVDRLTAWAFPTLLAALLTVTTWKLLTGGLHLDGLADCLDALGGHDVLHRLTIMRDSRIGAFGTIGLILFLLLEIAAVAELAPTPRWRVLLIAPVVSRAMPAFLARVFRPARSEGQGARFHADVHPRAVAVAAGCAVAAATVFLGALGLVAVAVAGLVSVAVGRFMNARLGGVTGDVLGAAVELSELAVLLTASAWTHVPR
jgi:adenosylcobinamide-GDP ribazoletransferase